ncbi:hypothetical protein GGS23DRAFT_157127 [Durotheca rogersii]|uniref:uncharacterized protein n=1 Tax=Durotheca rogersii TaxID=419775 RepID=UPI0022210A16|nr:uncharacterized protein GGS23DRAFT_157127 [Durotheca rogersii]KAI5861182.1 hypothetical protein GGS23DRAFT_157127 [Durotheca rogersii]
MRVSSSIAAVALLSGKALAQCRNDSISLLSGEPSSREECAPGIFNAVAALCGDVLGITGIPTVPVVVESASTTITESFTSFVTTVVVQTAAPGPVGRRQQEEVANYLTLPTLAVDSPSPSPFSACPTVTSLPTETSLVNAISSACSCLSLSIPPTVTSTALNIIVSTETVTSAVTLTRTATTGVTPTGANERCSVGYKTGGSGSGNSVISVEAVSNEDCCEQCHGLQNCVASAYTGTQCQLLVKQVPESGAATSNQCPLGVENYSFGEVGGIVYPGPCGA